MKIDYEYQEYKPEIGARMTVVWREMVKHQNCEIKKLTEAIKKAIEKEYNKKS